MKRIVGIMSLVVLLGGCAAPMTTREKGVLTGGALGAGAGALIGSQLGHHAGKGALIGGALGALGGGLVGDQMQGQEQRQNTQSSELEENRRELDKQRREIDNLRRDRYGSEGRDQRYNRDRYDDERYDDHR
jgi:osmotically inducible lipoprotein OsmB